MALINPQKNGIKEKIKIEIDEGLYNEIKDYCQWASVDDLDYFFEQSAKYILSKDKEYQTQFKRKYTKKTKNI